MIEQTSTKINCSDIVQYDTKEFRGARRSVTFPMFANKTDEKNQTIKLLSTFLNNDLSGLIANISSNYYSHDVVDLGAGSGELAKMVVQYLGGTFKTNSISRNITYFGMDRELKLVEESKSKLSTLEFLNHTIVQGDCFGENIDSMIERPILLIASQMIYYASEGQLNKFIDLVAKKTGRVSIIVAQANGSFLNKIAPTYDQSKKIDNTEIKVEHALNRNNVTLNHIKLYYSSRIFFPKTTYEKLILISLTEFNQLDSEDKEIRGLVEFVAATSMERLFCMDHDKFYHFIGDLYNHLKRNNFEVKFWNYVIFTVPYEFLSKESLHTAFQTLTLINLSGNATSFADAVNESNYEMAYAMYRQGFMSCQLHNYTYAAVGLHYYIKSLIKYELSLRQGWKEFLELFNINLDESSSLRNVTSVELLKMKSIKYNYTLVYGTLNPAEDEKEYREALGSRIRDWFIISNFEKQFSAALICSTLATNIVSSLIFEFLPSFILILPFLIPDHNNHALRLALVASTGLTMMYQNFWKKYFLTSNIAIHHISGSDFFLQLYLFNQSTYPSLKVQNSDGETALHVAIANEDLEKCANLLSCSQSVLESLINIRDRKGKFPIHYASEKGNIEALKSILEKKFDINAVVAASYLDYFSDSLFFLGKALYLFSFVSSIENSDNNLFSILRLTVFGVLYYTTSFYFNLKFPDGLYYIAFLNRLNPHDDWDNSFLNINTIYDGYSYNAPLHLSTKYNHTELSLYLINHQNININKMNAKGETALHFASANNNIQLLESLIAKNVNINVQTLTGYQHHLLDTLLKTLLLLTGGNGIFSFLSQIAFIKILQNEMLFSFHFINKATPLHYAVGGMYLSDHNLLDNGIEDKNVEYNTVVRLIGNGVDPDLCMIRYSSPELQIISYAMTKLTLILLQKVGISSSLLNKATTLFFYQIAFLHINNQLKTIDLLQIKEGPVHSYLAQYTTMNKFTTTDDISWYNPEWLLYSLGLLSDDDIIEMKDYGTYMGGTGKDKFVIHANYKGKEEDYKLIIKDFKRNEDCIDFKDICIADLYFEAMTINKQSALVIKSNKEEIVILLGEHKDIENYENLYCANYEV